MFAMGLNSESSSFLCFTFSGYTWGVRGRGASTPKGTPVAKLSSMSTKVGASGSSKTVSHCDNPLSKNGCPSSTTSASVGSANKEAHFFLNVVSSSKEKGEDSNFPVTSLNAAALTSGMHLATVSRNKTKVSDANFFIVSDLLTPLASGAHLVGEQRPNPSTNSRRQPSHSTLMGRPLFKHDSISKPCVSCTTSLSISVHAWFCPSSGPVPVVSGAGSLQDIVVREGVSLDSSGATAGVVD